MQGDITEELVETPIWSDAMLRQHGIPVYDIPFVSIGGGIGSFAMVDTLRIAGVGTESMRVISDIDRPSKTYEYLASNSQIRSHHRLRSDSGSVIDCIWGWPGYALRESWANKHPGVATQVLVEPIGADYYTPKAGQVYESLNREAQRIQWRSMVNTGVVRHIRKRDRGDYFVLYTPPDGAASTRRIAYRTRYVHLAVGYPGVRFLDDLQDYRQKNNDYQRVVNAYEPHDHVYAEMRQRPCTVLVRGAGIVASRVLQRLIDDRDQHGAQTTIIHLFRNYPSEPQGDKATFRRPAKKGWVYQGFNFPKAAWGGQLRDQLEALEGPERAAFIDRLGGTNTAPRKYWRQQLERGEHEGFYQQARGVVESVVPSPDTRQIRTVVNGPNGLPTQFDADFIIDATGLEANIEEHRVINDVLTHVGAQKNVKGRLDVERDFLVRGADSGEGHIYASGSMTLGGYYAGVRLVPRTAVRGASDPRFARVQWFRQTDWPSSLHLAVVEVGKEHRDMTPTLAGRIQTRLVLLATVGIVWTLIIGLFVPRPDGASAGDVYRALFTALLIVAVLGIVWETIYHGLQQYRWEKDWPTILGLVVAIQRGSYLGPTPARHPMGCRRCAREHFSNHVCLALDSGVGRGKRSTPSLLAAVALPRRPVRGRLVDDPEFVSPRAVHERPRDGARRREACTAQAIQR